APIQRPDLDGAGVRFTIGPHAIELVAPKRGEGPLVDWLKLRGESPFGVVLAGGPGARLDPAPLPRARLAIGQMSGGTSMACEVRLGSPIPQRGVPFGVATWPQMVALAREADRIALFDSLWVGDSVMAKPRPDSISLLGALCAATTRLKLGVGCMASFPIR